MNDVWFLVGSHSGPFSIDIIQPHTEGKHVSTRYGRFDFIAKDLKIVEVAEAIVYAHNSSIGK